MSGGSAYSVGSLHSRNVISSPELKERFDAPGYILDPMGSNPNRTTLSILTEACADSAKRELGRRILRALDFVRLAYVNYTGVAEANRVVLLCTAFEALLLRGKSGAKAKPIGEKLDELLAPGEPREARKDSRGEHTKLGWWFRDFYSLRNFHRARKHCLGIRVRVSDKECEKVQILGSSNALRLCPEGASAPERFWFRRRLQSLSPPRHIAGAFVQMTAHRRFTVRDSRARSRRSNRRFHDRASPSFGSGRSVQISHQRRSA